MIHSESLASWLNADTFPPGSLLLVVGSSALDSDEKTFVLSHETPQCTMDEYLAQNPESSIHRNRYSRIVIFWDGLGVSALRLLNRGHQLLREQGNFSVVLKHELNDDEPVAELRQKAYYLQVLARHCGFAVTSASTSKDGSVVESIFEKSSAPRWVIDEPESDDVMGLIDLFRKSFGTEINREFWWWKYGSGRGRATIAWYDGEIVAHYAGTLRKIFFKGRTVSALAICDVMVAPKERGVMTKRGAFYHVASAFLETFFGYHNEYFLAYGFPNIRHMRVAEKLGLYGEVERIAEFRWTPLQTESEIATVRLPLDDQPNIDGIVESLWELMRQDLTEAVSLVRDAAYIRYRYLSHPEHLYDLFLVADSSKSDIRGLFVLRREKDECKLLDILAPLREVPVLIDHARRQIGCWGLSSMSAWITMSYTALFAQSGGQQADTEVCIPTNVLTEGPQVQELKGRWWLMMGDTEFL